MQSYKGKQITQGKDTTYETYAHAHFMRYGKECRKHQHDSAARQPNRRWKRPDNVVERRQHLRGPGEEPPAPVEHWHGVVDAVNVPGQDKLAGHNGHGAIDDL